MEVTELAPARALEPFVRSFILVETAEQATRDLIPEPGLIVGFRYGGSASQLHGSRVEALPGNSVAGFHTSVRRIRTSAGGGTVLVKLKETGAAQLFAVRLDELFGRTIPLEDLVPRSQLERISEQVQEASLPTERVQAVEQFLLARLGARPTDPIVSTAVGVIRETRGAVRIAGLARRLALSQDALEKRFRSVVGATPKQLATLTRLRWVVASRRPGVNLSELAVEAGYADQSHFIRAFRAMAGEAPQRFLGAAEYC